MSLSLSSPAFANHGEIPRRYTADGVDVPPPLSFTGIPERARSLALVVADPDAPRPDAFAHWVVYDIPPAPMQLEEGEPPREGTEGINDFGRRGYAGPKPPSGRHRYVFTLYALDTMLGGIEPRTKEELEQEMHGHVLDRVELVGTYARPG